MKNIAFSIWAVGWPIAMSISGSECNEYSVTVEFLAATLVLAIWAFVGYKLFEK